MCTEYGKRCHPTKILLQYCKVSNMHVGASKIISVPKVLSIKMEKLSSCQHTLSLNGVKHTCIRINEKSSHMYERVLE